MRFSPCADRKEAVPAAHVIERLNQQLRRTDRNHGDFPRNETVAKHL